MSAFKINNFVMIKNRVLMLILVIGILLLSLAYVIMLLHRIENKNDIIISELVGNVEILYDQE